MPTKARPNVHVRFRIYEKTPDLFKLFSECSSKNKLALELMLIGLKWRGVESNPLSLVSEIENLINQARAFSSVAEKKFSISGHRPTQLQAPGSSHSIDEQNNFLRGLTSSVDDLLGGPE